jgi:hypothetical protein
MSKLTDFTKGIIAGFTIAVIIFGFIFALWFFNKRDKEILQYVELQQEIEALREDIINRPADGFLEIPGVRGAADGAAAEFDRKRDEAVFRFRSGLADR